MIVSSRCNFFHKPEIEDLSIYFNNSLFKSYSTYVMQAQYLCKHRYDDGSGGCDGCLNWSGVGVVHEDAPSK